MSRVHRVALRMEKPGRVTANLAAAFVWGLLAIAYAVGWQEPTRFLAVMSAALLAASYVIAHIEAHNEYATYKYATYERVIRTTPSEDARP